MRWLLLSVLLAGCGSDSGVGTREQGGAAGETPTATGGALEAQAGDAGEPGGSGIGGSAQGGALPVAGAPGRGGAGVGGSQSEGGYPSDGGALGVGGTSICPDAPRAFSCARFEANRGDDCLIIDVPGLSVGEVSTDPVRAGWTLVECITQRSVPYCDKCEPSVLASPTGRFCELTCPE